MNVTRTHTFVDGDTLTAAQLNAEFNNLLNSPSIMNADVAGGAAIVFSKLDSSTVAGVSATQTLSNKTFSDAITLSEIATPSSPSASSDKLYFKSDGNLYKLNSSGTESIVGGAINRSTTEVVVSNTSVETTLFTYSVPANTLSTNRWLRITMFGTFFNNSGSQQNMTLALKYGAATVGSTIRATNNDTNNENWTAEAYIAGNGATNAQKGAFSIHGVNQNQTFDNAIYGTSAIDSTQAQTLLITVLFANANPNLNIKLEGSIVEVI